MSMTAVRLTRGTSMISRGPEPGVGASRATSAITPHCDKMQLCRTLQAYCVWPAHIVGRAVVFTQKF